jgi:hypothetical protein
MVKTGIVMTFAAAVCLGISILVFGNLIGTYSTM